MTNYAALSLEPMLLCFDSYEDRIAKGRLKTLSYPELFQFESMDHLLMLMDEVLDVRGFPREMGTFRHLRTEHRGGKAAEPENRYEFPKSARVFSLSKSAQKEEKSFKGQMTITIRRRESNSMQGTINVKGEKTQFRSALELMYMFHEYLEVHFRTNFQAGCEPKVEK